MMPVPKSVPTLLLLLFAWTCPLGAQTGPEAVASFSHSGNVSNFSVAIQDPENRLWMLQVSPDTREWSDLDHARVSNGSFTATALHASDAPHLFFRAALAEDQGLFPITVAEGLMLPGSPLNYANPTLPPHLLTPLIRGQDNTPGANPTTDAGATLGRVLFYDKRLSANNSVSCASCHQPEFGFTDGRKFSVGFEGGLTGRNAMGLTSARYYLRGRYFWDEQAATLEDQVLQPIQNAVEMGMTLPDLVAKLALEPFYAELFANAFGSPTVNSNRISRALAQFVRSIVSGNSKYDQGLPVNFSNFTAEENRGRSLFLGQAGNATCAACHGSDNFVPGNLIFNNGLENPYVDKGVGEVSGLPQDEGLFKVPTLRNVELTAPYMHDGRFATLEEVVDFYNAGVVNHPNLPPSLRNPPGAPGPPGAPRRLNLSATDKAALVAFLKTLTDRSVIDDPKFADPFRYAN